MAADKKSYTRMAQLRKYISNNQEAELVKDMIADGLNNQQILQALGFTGEANRLAHPDAHGYSNKTMTDEEEQQAIKAQKGEDPQPGQPGQPDAGSVGGVPEGVVEGEEQGDESDPITHLVGLLSHITRNKAKNKPQTSTQSSNTAKPLT